MAQAALKPVPHERPVAAATAPQPAGAVLATSHGGPDEGAASILQRIAALSGKGPMQTMRDFAGLAFGPGKVSLADFVKLRLFDDAFWAGGDRRAVVGQRRNRDLVVELNWRHDWFGLMSNKIASVHYLAAFGLPVIETRAIYAPHMQRPVKQLLRTHDELRAFLFDAKNYPLFGKPVESRQSLGSIGLKGCDAARGMLISADGSEVAIDALMLDIDANYAGAGYVFQPMLMPHRDIVALAGPRLATSRIVTIATEDGPRVFRASWKIPGGTNVADNYWREGNLLAGIDIETGRILHATTGQGLGLRDVSHHADTGVALAGAQLPNFDQMKAVALEGARLMRHLSIIGWDMASTDAGPVIVEMNETPDLFLNQLADRRGVLDDDMRALVTFQKRNAQAFEKQMKSDIAKL